ncbi:MAG: hypothetical protein ACJ77K_17440 [Bacteroidia bacterium]
MKATFIPMVIFAALAACNTKTEAPAAAGKNNELVVGEGVQTILSLEADTSCAYLDPVNIRNKFDREKLFKSIIRSVVDGKMKAYRNFPDGELSVKEVQGILVQWDSTAQVEDPEHPGTFVSAPIKMEISSANTPQIRFHETIALDTLTGKIDQKISYLTLYTYAVDREFNVNGVKKVFDVKLN